MSNNEDQATEEANGWKAAAVQQPLQLQAIILYLQNLSDFLDARALSRAVALLTCASLRNKYSLLMLATLGMLNLRPGAGTRGKEEADRRRGVSGTELIEIAHSSAHPIAATAGVPNSAARPAARRGQTTGKLPLTAAIKP